MFKKIFDKILCYLTGCVSKEPYLEILNKEKFGYSGYVDFTNEEEVHSFANSLGMCPKDYEVRWMSSEEKEKLNYGN